MVGAASLSKVYIAGHLGLVGAAVVRAFEARGRGDLLLATRADVDLTCREAVRRFFAIARPECVVLAAARVGGIAANIAAPVEFLVQNLEIQNNVLMACVEFGVEKAVFLGSSCIYPREAPQPMREEYLMTGPLEPTNESYALAKLAGIRLAQAIHAQYGTAIACPIPSNVYGPGDHFEFERAHVLSALVRRFSEARASGARSVRLWGTGLARREFLHVDDLADACLFMLETVDSPEPLNVGAGVDYSIAELADLIRRAVGYGGDIEWDHSKPDGMPRKLLDLAKIHSLGWHHRIDLEEGIGGVIADYETWRARQLNADWGQGT